MRSRSFAALVIATTAFRLVAGVLDNAWFKGTTDKDPLTYRAGEEIVFKLELTGLDGEMAEGEYLLDWKRTDDFGGEESGRIPLSKKPFVYRAKLEKPGFVRLEAKVLNKDGTRYVKKYVGDTSTPKGRKAMEAFAKKPHYLFFDGGAGVDVAKIPPVDEPPDFDDFWARQYARLDKVPIKADRIEVPTRNKSIRLYAVRVDCAGLRPVTGYLMVPKDVEKGKKFPCRLETHGYSKNLTQERPGRIHEGEIVFNINAHGLKLQEFGATEADTKALKWDAWSNGRAYAFDPEQNKDPEVAYFNGMVLRVKRALQYLKTLDGWNGKDLIASGGSQGGLQTIWAGGCGEGVTCVESSVTWCCDLKMNDVRLAGKAAGSGWYVPWVDGLGYYDAVNFAKRIPVSCRTVIPRAGLGDYVCPPRGLAKLWNAIPGDNKKIVWVQGSQHLDVPPEYEGRDFPKTK